MSLTLTKTIQLLKSREATQLQAQDMAMPETGTIQAIKSWQQKPSHKRRLTQPAGKISKSQKPCWYYGRRHEFKRRHVQQLTNYNYVTFVTKRATLRNSTDQQELTMWKMITVMTRKYSLSTQLKVLPINLLWSPALWTSVTKLVSRLTQGRPVICRLCQSYRWQAWCTNQSLQGPAHNAQ